MMFDVSKNFKKFIIMYCLNKIPILIEGIDNIFL